MALVCSKNENIKRVFCGNAHERMEPFSIYTGPALNGRKNNRRKCHHVFDRRELRAGTVRKLPCIDLIFNHAVRVAKNTPSIAHFSHLDLYALFYFSVHFDEFFKPFLV